MILAGDLRDLHQNFVAVHHARGIVRIDNQDRLGAVADFAANIVRIGVPVVFRVAAVEVRHAAAEIGVVAPQRIAGGRQQNFVACPDQGGNEHGRRLADAVANEHVIRRDALQAAGGVVRTDGIARLDHAAHVAVGHRPVDLCDQRFAYARRQLKAKARRISGVQLQNVRPRGLHAQRFLIQRAANIGMDVIQVFGTRDHFIRPPEQMIDITARRMNAIFDVTPVYHLCVHMSIHSLFRACFKSPSFAGY